MQPKLAWTVAEWVVSSQKDFAVLEIVSRFRGKLVAFQQHVTQVWKMNSYILSQIEYASEMRVYFCMLLNYTIDDIWAQTCGAQNIGW